MMGVAIYAWRECLGIAVVGAALTWLVALYLGWWAVLPALLTLALLAFYRDPPRRVPPDPALLLAPADGRIVDISRAIPTPDGPRLRIMIFLSVLDVHLNRAPCAGDVIACDYRPGKFGNALSPAADHENESNTLTLTPVAPLPGPVRVRQIAGLLARRIVCVAAAGARLNAGERYGMIKLGSRTEVVVPEDQQRWVILVRVGQSVRGGVTALARFQPG